MVRQLKQVGEFLKLSFTYNRGLEMTLLALMSAELSLDNYIADPH